MRRDLDVDLDVVAAAAQAPDRSKLREVFREFELRDPLRRLEEFLGAERGRAGAAWRRPRSAPRACGPDGSPTSRFLRGDELVLVVRAPAVPEGELLARRRLVALRRRRRRRGADRRDRRSGAARRGRRRAAGRRLRRQGARRRRRRTSSTTRCSAPTCSSRRGAATRCASCSRSAASARPASRTSSPPRRCSSASCRPGSASRSSSATSSAVMEEIELPLVAVLRRMELDGRAPEHRAPARDHRARARGDPHARARDLASSPGTEFVIGSPQQLGEVLFVKLGLSKKRRGKTGFSTDARVLQAIRDEHEIIPLIERWRELNQLDKTYFSVLPQLVDATVADPHDVPAGGRHDRPPGVDEPEHAERPDPHRARARDPRLLRRRRRATSC